MPINNQNNSLNSSVVKIASGGFWIYLTSGKDPNYIITGKYLFFYVEKEKLIEIAKNEI